MHRLATATTGSLLVLASLTVSLTACGGDDEAGSGDYCADIAQAQEDFDDLEQGNPDAFDQVYERMQLLRDEAPDEVADDWETFTGAFEAFTGALEDAGLDVEDLSDPQAQQQLDAETQQDLQEAAAGLSSAEVSDAQTAIQEHAETECDVDLDGGADEGSGSD